ncbi:MAG: replication initiation protein [Synergistetes bacterium]|nr:replication initiation protein [Synergistota bacterium]
MLDMVGDKGYEVKTTRYELCKRLFGARSSWRYERVEKGLERLAATTIRFQGSFYKDGEYVSAIFHYLDDVQKDDSGKLRIRLSKRLVDWLRETNYVRHIDIIKFMQFKKPVSSRLYEILVKSFEDRNVYRTNILRLRDKLGIQQAFPSHVYREVKLAVDEINRTTELNIKLGYNSKSKVLSFKRIERTRKKEKDGRNAEIDGNYQDENGVIYKVYQVGSSMIMALRLRDNATFTIDMETLNTWSRLKDY